MKLCECAEGQEITVKSIATDEITLKRLENMGIRNGVRLLVVKESRGSVLVVNNGKMVALGRALTEGVTVDACSDCR